MVAAGSTEHSGAHEVALEQLRSIIEPETHSPLGTVEALRQTRLNAPEPKLVVAVPQQEPQPIADQPAEAAHHAPARDTEHEGGVLFSAELQFVRIVTEPRFNTFDALLNRRANHGQRAGGAEPKVIPWLTHFPRGQLPIIAPAERKDIFARDHPTGGENPSEAHASESTVSFDEGAVVGKPVRPVAKVARLTFAS